MIYKLKLIVYNYCNSITSKYFILLNYKFILFKTKPDALFVNMRIVFNFAKISLLYINYKYKNKFPKNISSTFYKFSVVKFILPASRTHSDRSQCF